MSKKEKTKLSQKQLTARNHENKMGYKMGYNVILLVVRPVVLGPCFLAVFLNEIEMRSFRLINLISLVTCMVQPLKPTMKISQDQQYPKTVSLRKEK